VGHAGQGVCLLATYKCNRLRREQQLSEHERNTGPDEDVGQSLEPSLTAGHRNGKDRGRRALIAHKSISTQRMDGDSRYERRQTQAHDATAKQGDHQLAGRDPDGHTTDHPHGTQASFPSREAQRDYRSDRREEWILVACETTRDHPGEGGRGGAL
jgi:hypothetical protein